MRSAAYGWRRRNPLRRCWSDLVFYWYTRDNRDWALCALLVLPSLALALAIYLFLTAQDHNPQLLCLALNVYHESRGEPVAGQYAVAEVTMNRVRSGAYPDTVCEVVYEKRWDRIRRRPVGAFSWTELDETGPVRAQAWQQAWQVAEAVYHQQYEPRLQGALHYHARNIKPSWAQGKKPIARIGKHVFYP